jgi:hypothetical protein
MDKEVKDDKEKNRFALDLSTPTPKTSGSPKKVYYS